MYYLFDTCGFHWGTFASREDAIEAMEECKGDEEFFITTQENPWEVEDAFEESE